MKTASSFPVFAATFALALSAGGCLLEEEDGEPIPQQESSIDLEPQESGAARLGLPVEDHGPHIAPVTTPRTSRYDRRRALEYVNRYARSPNRRFAHCADWNSRLQKVPADCTNFASQTLSYGGLPQRVTGRPDSGWWYASGCSDGGSSRSWRSVNGLVSYLIAESGAAEFRPRARDLKIGDLILYRLRREEDGYACNGNLFNHATVVSGFDADGEPVVSYHSNEAHRVRWDKRNGSMKSLGEACLIGFVHIKD